MGSRILADLADLYRQVVTLEAFLGYEDGFGTPAFGPPIDYAARIEQKARLVRTGMGEVVPSMTRVHLAVTPPKISTLDRITLPPGLSPNQPPILAVSLTPDDDGELIAAIDC